MIFRTPNAWYIEPPTLAILNPLSMIYQTIKPWQFDPYLWYIEHSVYLMIRNEGVQNTIRVQFTIQGEFIFQ